MQLGHKQATSSILAHITIQHHIMAKRTQNQIPYVATQTPFSYRVPIATQINNPVHPRLG